jgi:3-hydroxymyristoyl/3-hydroxydecanoyl-(acyl carrier protein) dehydratase
MTPPTVLSIRRPDPDQVVLGLALPSDSPAFAGHFPDRPILPGVVQIDWAVRLAADHLVPGLAAARDFQVKFTHVIAPEADLTLTLRLDRQRQTLRFEYRDGRDIASSGSIALEPPP